MISFPKLALASALLSLGACAATSTPPETASQPAAETIAVSVGPCFGFCPVYKVAVSPAGMVTFTGERHTTEPVPRPLRSRFTGPGRGLHR